VFYSCGRVLEGSLERKYHARTSSGLVPARLGLQEGKTRGTEAPFIGDHWVVLTLVQSGASLGHLGTLHMMIQW